MKKAPRRRMQRKFVGNERAMVRFTSNSYPAPANEPFAFRNFSLTNSTRATAVAKAYQYYRITQVIMYIRPCFDTYQSGANVASLPHLYHLVDKDGNFPAVGTLETMKALGAKPRRLDDKVIKLVCKPRVISQTVVSTDVSGNVQSAPGISRVSPWLPTNATPFNISPNSQWTANSVDHSGFIVAIDADQLGSLGTSPIAYISTEVHYEFKDPLWISAEGQGATVKHVDCDTMTLVGSTKE